MKFHNSKFVESKPKCPKCGHSLDSAAAVNGQQILPSPGDLTICVYCRCVCVFEEKDNELSLRFATEKEREILKSDKFLSAMADTLIEQQISLRNHSLIGMFLIRSHLEKRTKDEV
jgi:hypothetical protein